MCRDVKKNRYSVEQENSQFRVWIQGVGRHRMFEEPNGCMYFFSVIFSIVWWKYSLSSMDESMVGRTTLKLRGSLCELSLYLFY